MKEGGGGVGGEQIEKTTLKKFSLIMVNKQEIFTFQRTN